MILTTYRVAPSTIPGAGKGLFVDAPVKAGRIIVAPDAINRVYRWDEVLVQPDPDAALASSRTEEHTSELQSLMRISYAVLCLKKTNNSNTNKKHIYNRNTID